MMRTAKGLNGRGWRDELEQNDSINPTLGRFAYLQQEEWTGMHVEDVNDAHEVFLNNYLKPYDKNCAKIQYKQKINTRKNMDNKELAKGT